jgi:hypothetical protein
MENLVLITSIINPPNTPLSYGVRSIFNTDQRFEQTKLTIHSVKEKIPNATIFIVECSELNEEQNDYFLENSTYFLNLYNNENLRANMHSDSKSLCEGTMTFCALEFLLQNDIKFDNLIKISGRYYLSDDFDCKLFNNSGIVIKYINNDINNVFTGLYKLPRSCIEKLKLFLQNNVNKMISYIGYEVLFAEFIKEKCIDIHIDNHTVLGLSGYVSVSGDLYNG